MEICLVNGQSGHISPDHRALAYGDGLFETILYHSGHLEFLDDHLARLMQGCTALKLQWSIADQTKLIAQLAELTAGLSEPHVIKIMALRNSPGRGYGFNALAQSTDLIIQIKPYQKPDWCFALARVCLASTKISVNPSLAGLKHLNRLDSVLARAEYESSQYDEVLLCDAEGFVMEGSMSNLFLRVRGQWMTPDLSQCGVAGIIRKQLLDKFSEIQVAKCHADSFPDVDAAFVCNSLIGVVPVGRLNQRDLSVAAEMNQFRTNIGIPC
jgi:4-amino-4-deoxychorismate lyase